jgi:hypothetical protein
VSLAVGDERRRLIVFGERRWRRSRLSDTIEASSPEPFVALPLTWEYAFGGGFDLEPGLLPGTDLPHPGGRVDYHLNTRGRGFYRDARAALDQPLPQVEYPDQLVKSWQARPEPAGFAPCPDLVALRVSKLVELATPANAPNASFDIERTVKNAFFVLHHAPPRLVFRPMAPDTPIEVRGLGVAMMRFQVPAPPLRVLVRKRAGVEGVEAVPQRVRSLHIDADRRTVRVTHGHQFHYEPAAAPSWISVEEG